MNAALGGPAEVAREPLSTAALCTLLFAALLVFSALVALGTWQLERRDWKLDLIDRVAQRVHAPPVAAPGPADWPQVRAARDEYRRVQLTGSYLQASETRVQASTVFGVGHWLLTPLRSNDGSVVLVNRGFVSSGPDGKAGPSPAPAPGTVTVVGLLRLSEPVGFFLRRNDAAADRWHSRDVQAIAAARGLGGVAPYFIDAGTPGRAAAHSLPSGPIDGLTVIDFPNNHLVYALTWYTLALMVAAAAAWVMREEICQRRARGSAILPGHPPLPGDAHGC